MDRENASIVAVVDDDDDVGEVLRSLLEVTGFQVETYRSGSEFLSTASLGQIGCLVVDQKMPGMTGVQLLSTLNDRGIVIPSVLITGVNDSEVRRDATALGVMRVMEKPLSPGELLRFISYSVG